MDIDQIIFTKPKRTRDNLRLPTLYHIAGMDWIPKMGRTTFSVWIELQTMADQDGRIPHNLGKTAELLEMSRPTFQKYLKVLWNYGFIDLEECEAYEGIGQKPLNIHVYEYPQNDYSRGYKPLEKVRDYDRDYIGKEK